VNGAVSYMEIGAMSGTKTNEFFSKLLGWKFNRIGKEGDEGNEGWFETPSGFAGMHTMDPTPGITVFFEVADLEAAAAQVRVLGGEAGPLSKNEPGFGQFCICKDPEGIAFGLHKKA
jgi:uncharacterized protein